MSTDPRTILARTTLSRARNRAQQVLAAARGQVAGTQQTIELRGVIEEGGLGWLAPPTTDPTMYNDAEEDERRAALRADVRRAAEYHREAVNAQLALQPGYLVVLQGGGTPATVAQTKAEYALAEQAVVLAAEEETAARVALSQFEAEAKRRALARERAAIAERDAARAAGRQDARRDRARDLVARVTAQRQAGPQPATLLGRTFRVKD
jgi:hypothetical protein